MRVLKFGGSSVATPESIRRVTRVLADARNDDTGRAVPVVAVVSALGGVTDALLGAADTAEQRGDWRGVWQELRERHLAVAAELAPGDSDLAEGLVGLHRELRHLLHGVALLREVSPRVSDAIAAYGERLSARLVAAALRAEGVAAEAVDTRPLVLTDDHFGRAEVDLDVTYERLAEHLREILGRQTLPVVTGFTGATADGQTTTLGRGGSDYTAALVGAALRAEAVELWTDVSGVMTADPRIVSTAFVQPHLSYAELMELSHFGAKVVYAPSVHPARTRGIALLIKNTFAPEDAGTEIADQVPPSGQPIRGITSIRSVALVRLEGDGMVGVPGIAERLFGALARRRISVILISQSSSEHSICFAVDGGDAEVVERAVNEAFRYEQERGDIDPVIVERGQTVVAVVGEEMAHQPGIAGRIFGVLGEHGVNVRAIAQGSSELNVSLVVAGDDEKAAVRAIHDAFFERRRRVEILLLGTGRVGGALLRQLAEHRRRLKDDALELRLVAVAGSRQIVEDAGGLEPETAAETLRAAPESDVAARLDALLRTGRRRILVDCTASGQTAALYTPGLERGVAIVVANKKPFTGPHEDYRAMLRASGAGASSLRFETTVGAGLPILSTLSSLLATGDRLERLDGVLSGTLNAVLDRVSAKKTLSAAVREAFEEGLTEPHPHEDLSGADVQRKLCILARVAGHGLELDEITVEPLVPDAFGALDLETFWQRLPELDEAFEARRLEAERAGRRLRYLASLEPGPDGEDSVTARVGLVATAADHPAHRLAGPDNLVAFTTARYHQTPLVVRGPGAGPAVTAAGVFADLLDAAHRFF